MIGDRGHSIVRTWERAEDLCAIEGAAAARYVEPGYDPSDWPETSPQDFRDYDALGLLWVAAVDGRAVGFAVGDVYGENFHLEEIDVLPEVQGRGLGAALIAALIEEATRRGMAAVTLRTFLTTPWSVRLYEKIGFRRWDPAPLPDFLSSLIEGERDAGLAVEDRLTMRLPLNRD